MGLESLIDAMQRVHETAPEALCVLVGKGRLADQLQARISRLNLEKNVRLLGFVPDDKLPLIYRAADFSVMPSQSLEGFGLSAVESLAAGTPVLVTPVGGLPEVVRDLDSRLVTRGFDARALADAISEAILNPSVLPAGDACARYARGRFHWPVIARQIRGVYEAALS